jgi:hypothetical protein
VYDIVDACQRHHGIFVVLRQNYPTQYTVIQLPQRCHDDFVKFLDFIATYHIESGVISHTLGIRRLENAYS